MSEAARAPGAAAALANVIHATGDGILDVGLVHRVPIRGRPLRGVRSETVTLHSVCRWFDALGREAPVIGAAASLVLWVEEARKAFVRRRERNTATAA